MLSDTNGVCWEALLNVAANTADWKISQCFDTRALFQYWVVNDYSCSTRLMWILPDTGHSDTLIFRREQRSLEKHQHCERLTATLVERGLMRSSIMCYSADVLLSRFPACFAEGQDTTAAVAAVLLALCAGHNPLGDLWAVQCPAHQRPLWRVRAEQAEQCGWVSRDLQRRGRQQRHWGLHCGTSCRRQTQHIHKHRENTLQLQHSSALQHSQHFNRTFSSRHEECSQHHYSLNIHLVQHHYKWLIHNIQTLYIITRYI